MNTVKQVTNVYVAGDTIQMCVTEGKEDEKRWRRLEIFVKGSDAEWHPRLMLDEEGCKEFKRIWNDEVCWRLPPCD